LIRPYQLVNNPETGLYSFTTDRNINYVCKFQFINPSLSPVLGIYDLEIYEFDFYPESIHKGKDKADNRISETITNLFASFFVNNLRVLVYICDSSDGRQKERHVLFDKWHKKNQADILINRIPLEIKIEDGIVYGCILMRHDFPHMDILERELVNKAPDIIASKF